MSLKPIRSKRRKRNNHPRLEGGSWNYQWKPIRVREGILGLFGRKSFVLGMILLVVMLGSIGLYADKNNPTFHSLSPSPPSLLDQGCAIKQIVSTCETAKLQLVDPSYPVTKYYAPNGNLAEFNTAGKVAFTGSCTNFGTSNCLTLTPQSANPSITTTTSNSQNEWPWQQKTFFAQGLYWVFYRSFTNFNGCTTANELCVYWASSPFKPPSTAWSGGLEVGGGSGIACGSQVNPNFVPNLSVFTNGTWAFVLCDTSTFTNACCTGTGAMWFVEGKLTNTAGVGSVSWQPVRQVLAGPGANMQFLNEQLAVSPIGRIFAGYTLTNTATHRTTPYAIVSTDHDGASWGSTLQLNTTLAGDPFQSLGYGWTENLFPFSDNKVLALYSIFTGDNFQLGGALARQRIYTEGSGWGSEAASGITDLLDGVDSAYSQAINYAWIDSPSPLVSSYTAIGTPGGSGWGDSCGFQDCGRPSWTYIETTNTWGDRQLITSPTVPNLAFDEHSQIFYDTLTAKVYLMIDDVSCITHTTPGWVYVMTKAGAGTGTWNNYPGNFILQQGPVPGNPQGGDPAGQGCSGGTGYGGFSAMTGTFVNATSNMASLGFEWIELLASPFNIKYGVVQFSLTGGINILNTAGSLFSLAESTVPIGDLSPAVSKELEMELDWQPLNNNTVTASCPNYQCSWGFFLTTNGTLWQTNNPKWTPYIDSSVALFDANYLLGSNQYSENLFIQQKPGETLVAEDNGCSGEASFICVGKVLNTLGAHPAIDYWDLNFTGSSGGAQVGVGSTCPSSIPTIGGPSCSFLVLQSYVVTGNIAGNPKLPDLLLSGQQYYIGFWAGSGQTGSGFNFCYDNGNICNAQSTFVTSGCVSASMEMDYCVPNPTSTNGVNSVTDSGGYFGSLWRGITSIGSNVVSFTQPLWGPGATFLNGVGSGLLGAFLGALEAAGSYIIQGLALLENALRATMDLIGNAVGLGNVGTSFFNVVNSIITLFTSANFGKIFTNVPSLFTALINSLAVYFPWLPNALALGVRLLTLGFNSIGFILTIAGFAMQFVSGAFATYLIAFWFIYTGDDSLAGILGLFETTQWLVFGIGLKYLSYLVNFSLDVVTNLIGLIPKPFIQMVAHQFPRIPIVEVNARFVWPSGSMTEIKNGNMLSAACWVSGVLFLDMYESANPTLPGSIGFLLPSAVSVLAPLAGFIPLLEIMTAFVWGAAFLMVPIQWLSNAFDFGEVPFQSAIGTRISGGFGGVRLTKAQKRFQGRLEKKLQLREVKGSEMPPTPKLVTQAKPTGPSQAIQSRFTARRIPPPPKENR